MPLYEFACLECGSEFESLVRRASEIAEVKCPVCGGKELEEKVSSFASVSKTGTAGSADCAPDGG